MTFEEHRKIVAQRNAEREVAGLGPLPKLTISFSGGRTSAVMTKRLWDERKDTHDIVITFANTGCEHPATLDFVFQCESVFGWPVVWIEAKVNPEFGKGVGYAVVDYASASRNGEPFEDVVAKYGIFNAVNPSCTARTKTDPMHAFLADQGFFVGSKLNCKTAIGIRSDEADRVSVFAAKQYGAIYPMVEWGMTKRDVGLAMAGWGFDLRIPGDHYGNCTWCWKKTLRKHLTLMKQSPEVFDFPERMEERYGSARPDMASTDDDGRAWWFRKHTSVQQLREMAKTREFQPYRDDLYASGRERDRDLDLGTGACGESCGVYADPTSDDASDWLFKEFAP